MIARSSMGLALLLASSGCVASNAGYRNSIEVVHERTGQTLRWDPDRAEDAAVSRQARRLLSMPLDPDRAAQVALLENHGLLAELESVGVARAALVGAGLLPNPRLEGQYLVAQDAGDTDTWSASATIGLADLVRLPARHGAAATALEAAALEAAGRALALAFDARVAVLRHVADLRRVALRRTDLEATAAAFEAARAITEAGGGTALDASLREVAYHEARLALADAEAAATVSRERLAVSLGLWGRDVGFTVADRLPDPPEDELGLDDVERRAVARSLDLDAVAKRIEATARRIGVQRWQGWLPDLELGAAVEHEPEGTRVGPAASLRVPLFDQGQAETGAAQAELRRLEHERIALAVRVRSAARAAASRLRVARERATFFRTVLLPARARIVEQMQLEVNAMSAGLYALLAARRDEVNAASRHVDALEEYWVARVRFQELLAGRLATDAAAPNAPAPPAIAEEGGH